MKYYIQIQIENRSSSGNVETCLPAKHQRRSSCDTQNSQKHLELSHVDVVPSNAKYSHEGPKLYIFEDNEAVMKMIMRGRSPNLRHVSRTCRVPLDWLFDRINLNPKIQIRCVDSKNQPADILTKGHFTRDEWNHLLCLFNISLFSSQSCSEFNSQNCFEAMAKRQQEGDYDERVVAKSKPVRNWVSVGGQTTWVSSTLGKFGSKDHEMRFETRTEKHRSNNQQENLIKRDRVTNSQERHEEARSRTTTGSPMTQKPSQTEDLTACTGYPAPTIKSWDAGIGLETKKECDILSAHSMSSQEEVDEWLRIHTE